MQNQKDEVVSVAAPAVYPQANILLLTHGPTAAAVDNGYSAIVYGDASNIMKKKSWVAELPKKATCVKY